MAIRRTFSDEFIESMAEGMRRQFTIDRHDDPFKEFEKIRGKAFCEAYPCDKKATKFGVVLKKLGGVTSVFKFKVYCDAHAKRSGDAEVVVCKDQDELRRAMRNFEKR